MRGDPTNQRELLASWLVVALILALVAVALRDVMQVHPVARASLSSDTDTPQTFAA
jgi:hypothetical protein